MSLILTELDKARKSLLDLSGRNRLTNYRRPTERNGGIEIIDEIPAEIYRLLVEESKAMTFLALTELSAGQQTLLLPDFQEGSPQLSSPTITSARHIDTKLQTRLDRDALDRRLKRIQNRARTFIEEQGINTLYLAMGLLQWYETESSAVKREAPLLLMPVELARDNVRSHYKVQYTGEEIGFNISLQELLLQEFAITLPQWSDGLDLDIVQYFGKVAETVANLPRWRVDTTALFVDFYKFNKLQMYHDLDAALWNFGEELEQHPILAKLLGNHSFVVETNPSEPPTAERLAMADTADVPIGEQVMDADSSQVRAISAVMAGKNLVIQGPPGTGKSQTITNLIAEAITQGKTVLFVAEKMAALQVVKRRLDTLGLGDVCLELHSNKSNKKAFLDELQRTLTLGQPKVPDRTYERKTLEEERAYLDRYSRLVNTTVGETGVTPFQAYGKALTAQRRLPTQESSEALSTITIPTIGAWTENDFLTQLEHVMRCQQTLSHMGMPLEHPYWGVKKQRLLPTEQQLIPSRCAAVFAAIQRVQDQTSTIAGMLGVTAADTHDFAMRCLHMAKLAAQAPPLVGIPIEEVCTPDGSWQSNKDTLVAITEQGVTYANAHAVVDQSLVPAALNEEWLPALQAITTHSGRFSRFFSWRYYWSQRRLINYSKRPLPTSREDQLTLLNHLLTVQRLQPLLEANAALCQRSFGALWNGSKPDWPRLQRVAKWIQQVLTSELDHKATDALLRFAHETTERNRLHTAYVELEHALRDFAHAINQLVTTLEIDETDLIKAGKLNGADTLLAAPFHALRGLIEDWQQQIERLDEITAYNRAIDHLQQGGLGALIPLVENWHNAPQHLVDLVQVHRYTAIIDYAMQAEPLLADFDGNTHQHRIARFRELDRLLLEHRRIEILDTHWATIPRYEAGGLAFLKEQFNRKRGHKSIRLLMEEAGPVIQRIKPIFMMSPFSIAMYLPANMVTFDLVIFDEASQVQPVDAFGAILRGRQAVVVGDDKQLPPTNFFDKVLDDESDDDTLVTDLESILAHFRARSAPEAMLEWHYRSRHESLIAVSNYEFYGNRLTVFPSPDKERNQLGLRFHHLPNTRYTRRTDGTSGGYNAGEARVVATAVLRHARQTPEKTLLVATFNQQQRDLVEDEVERLRKLAPDTDEFFTRHSSEPFVVKNLENVQGDERDVVLISVGFGRDQDGKLYMRFGPLANKGGERRLNVLITRARERCEVFSNITADDIDLSRTNAEGVKALKRFLYYAEKGVLDLPESTGGEAESPFEQAVADALRAAGHRVELQIGTGGYRVDMAIVDPERPGRYLLGIECDGATYHRTKSARDRDRLRQEVLESMGWTIHRIWSTDWFRNPSGELQRVEESFAKAKAKAAVADQQFPNATTDKSTMIDDDYEYSAAEDRAGISPTPRLLTVVDGGKDVSETEPSHDVVDGDWQVLESTATAIERLPSTPPSPFDLPRYEQARSLLFLRGDSLDNLQRARVEQELVWIVNIESPLHMEQLMQRVSYRLTQKVRGWVEPLIERLIRTKQIYQDGEYLLTEAHTQLDPRLFPVRRRAILYGRDKSLEYVYPAELCNAVLLVAVHTPAISREELGKETLKFIGYGRVSENMATIVDEAIGTLVTDGYLTQRGDRITYNQRR